MATKKELERVVKKQKEEISRRDKIIEKLRIQLSLFGVRGYRDVVKNRPQF